MKKQTSPPNRRGRLVLLCFVLGLILIVMLVGTVYLQHLLGRIHYVDSGTAPSLSPEELDAYLATQPEEANTAPTMNPEDVTFPDYDADIGRDSDIINILLIGQDRREDETRARSDSMILCTFRKSEKKLTMTSFLRDTYVKIPGYGQNRINVAYAAGGMSLLERVLPLITTDMTDREILGYAVSLFPLMTGGEVVSQHIPAAGTYASRNIDGMAVLVADLEANRQVLKDTLGG